MKLINYQHKVGEDFVLATFYGDITKLKPTLSLELSFERLGGEYMPEMSGEHGIIFKFPAFVSAGTLHEIIRNTCFECGGLMRSGEALDNTWVSFNDFGNDAGERGTTLSKVGFPLIKKVRKCGDCGHSYVS